MEPLSTIAISSGVISVLLSVWDLLRRTKGHTAREQISELKNSWAKSLIKEDEEELPNIKASDVSTEWTRMTYDAVNRNTVPRWYENVLLEASATRREAVRVNSVPKYQDKEDV